MTHLIIQTSIITTGYSSLTLYILSALAISCAVFVIVSKNPIVSVLFLIGLFFCIAFYLISIDFNFIGISYVLVYVGAVSILFLFILMLINIRVSELQSESDNSILLLLMIGLFFLGTITPIVPDQFINLLKEFKDITPYVNHNHWETTVYSMSNILSLGNVMYTSFSVWLILASIILLLAMVGAIVITIKPKDFYKTINTYKNSLIKLPAIAIVSTELSNSSLQDLDRILEETSFIRSDQGIIATIQNCTPFNNTGYYPSFSGFNNSIHKIPSIEFKGLLNPEVETHFSALNQMHEHFSLGVGIQSAFYLAMHLVLLSLFLWQSSILNSSLISYISHSISNYTQLYLTKVYNNIIVKLKKIVYSINNYVYLKIKKNTDFNLNVNKQKYNKAVFYNIHKTEYLNQYQLQNHDITVMMADENASTPTSSSSSSEGSWGSLRDSIDGEYLSSILEVYGFSNNIPTNMLQDWLNREEVVNFQNSGIDILGRWDFSAHRILVARLRVNNFNQNYYPYLNLLERVSNETHFQSEWHLTRLETEFLDRFESDRFESGTVPYYPGGNSMENTEFSISTDVIREIASNPSITSHEDYIVYKFMQAKLILYNILINM